MKHVVLAGDSIFDNDGYVLGEPGVIEQLRKAIPASWSAYKIAVDGHCIRHVADQLKTLPTNCTDLIVSVGGNDARQYSNLLNRIATPSDLQSIMSGPMAAFRAEYSEMLDAISRLSVRPHVCTIYTAVPFDDPMWRQYAPLAIAAFNTVIAEEAVSRQIPVFRLEEVCTEESDFAAVSPIEPSSTGGQKIVDHIVAALGA